MVKESEIPAYETLVPNSTWAREAEPFEHPISRKKCPATQIFQLVRYRSPLESEVIRRIQTTAKEFDTLLDKDYKRQEGIGYVLRALSRLPPTEIKKIAQEDEKSIEHLKLHYFRGPNQPGRSYILCINGTVPNKILPSLERGLKEHKNGAYEELIKRLKINRWHFMVRLDGKGELPNKGDLEFLLRNEVRECPVFKTDVKYNNYQDMAEQASIVFKVLSSREDIEKVEDISEKFLISSVINTIDGIFECIMKKKISERVIRGLMNQGLGGIFGGFMSLPNLGDEEERSDFFDDEQED